MALNVKNLIIDLSDKLSTFIAKKAPEICAGVGLGCFVATTVSAVSVTPKASKMLEEKKEELQTEELGAVETVKTVGKLYLPSIALGATGAAFVVGSVRTSNRRYLALSTSYDLLRNFTNTYREKVIETIGEKKDKKIRDAIAEDSVAKDSGNSPVVITNRGNVLFKDSLTGQYFRHDIDKVKSLAIEAANQQLSMPEGYISVYEWLMSLGLNLPGDNMMDLGWSIANQGRAMTIDFSAVVASKYNDEPCLVINYDPLPMSDYSVYY